MYKHILQRPRQTSFSQWGSDLCIPQHEHGTRRPVHTKGSMDPLGYREHSSDGCPRDPGYRHYR